MRVTVPRARAGSPDWVYSLEVAGRTHVRHRPEAWSPINCFPKDVTALKQLAGNSGYRFQLLNAVIEVNELQKRRVIGKLKKHLGDNLVHKKIALLGLSFKPNTDDMREASSLVLSARAGGRRRRRSHGLRPSAASRCRGRPTCRSRDLRRRPDGRAVTAADAAVVVTEWDEYALLELGAVSAGAQRR